ncbi:SEC-C domain-containing protein [Kibdelosporangium philippinense]|uniref:SEC-C domain-containing protein n=1 Tax=Kibdelosporangium philippinense TaxID=211113 RepID=A0ABS8ZKU1_9PSEU|nr:SEC-C metal-binding domain-containing protein [Kibdelosporangium philippinense]MCE7006417.1 SEC-C domain-containing protein [Kibdelosporangium philippinense]MCE7009307.1 SEC-C domain-containing protein [Kibdelosporangium philippinense]
MRTKPAAAIAAELEAELEHYPDERGQILVEAAEAWHQAGDHDRAIALLTQAIALGGEDGGNARVELVEVLFDLDQIEQAQAQLDELRHQRPSSPTPYHLAAELLEDRGQHQQALTWFNMAVARLTEQEMADRDTEFGFLSYANNIVAGRRRVRHALGIPPDELDESVQALSEQAEDLARALTPPAPREVRVLFWPRNEIPRAHEAWPRLVEHAEADTIIAEREAANRELSEAGIARITMVPLTTAKLLEFTTRTESDPTDEDTRLACMNEILEEGGTVSWPPARNAPCWCGSAIKYKKCCGRPHLD